MDKNAALCVYLKKYHTGKEKAVPSTELEQLFSLNGRNLQPQDQSLASGWRSYLQ